MAVADQEVQVPPAPFRDELLARLLKLNEERAEEECRAGLH